MASWILPSRSMTVVASDTTGTYYAMTDWIPASSVKDIKAVMWMSRRSAATITAIPAFQTATEKTDEPDAWSVTGMGSGIGGDGDGACTGVVSPTMSAKWFVRFGVQAKLSSGTDTVLAQVRMTVSGRD